METGDQELLRRYAMTRDERAFAQLVRRHVDFVYACALRRVGGDAHLAEDVTQQVFCDLARRARDVAGHAVLAGWLHTSTRFAAAHVVRSEQRRRAREEAAFKMNAGTEGGEQAVNWERLRPVLDETIDELDERDRAAVVLRFFEGRSFAEIGERLRLTENAARMRVERALDKLHGLLARRGIVSTSAALGLALGAHPAIAAPVGLASTVTIAALAGGAASAGAVGAGAGAWATFMSMTKLQVAMTGALAVASGVGLAVQAETAAELREEAAALRRSNAEMRTLEADNLRMGRLAAELEELRRDDAELARLEGEAGVLRKRLQELARAEEARAAAHGSGREVFEIGHLDQTPRPKFQARPQYPFELRSAGVQGEVIVDFVVDASGEVTEAKALRSSRSEFEAAAVDAVSKWKFAPGRKDGRDVATHMQVPIMFRLANGGPVPSASAKPASGAAAPGEETVRLVPFVTEAKAP